MARAFLCDRIIWPLGSSRIFHIDVDFVPNTKFRIVTEFIEADNAIGFTDIDDYFALVHRYHGTFLNLFFLNGVEGVVVKGLQLTAPAGGVVVNARFEFVPVEFTFYRSLGKSR